MNGWYSVKELQALCGRLVFMMMNVSWFYGPGLTVEECCNSSMLSSNLIVEEV